MLTGKKNAAARLASMSRTTSSTVRVPASASSALRARRSILSPITAELTTKAAVSP
jgi:hypothetical protein